MMHISHDIYINSFEDFETVVSIIRRQYIDNPVFIIDHNSSYSISFESDYEQYEMIKEIEAAFPEYERVDGIGLGISDVQMIVSRVQSAFSTDDWGRRLNTDNTDTTFYFVKRTPETTSSELPNPNIKVLLGKTEQIVYNINIANGMNPKTEEKGYLLLKDKVEGQERELLLNNLYKSKNDAFWGGYQEMRHTIEKQYEDYKDSQKRKKKNKLGFEDWLKAEAMLALKKKESMLSSSEILALKIGDKVLHDKFGMGVIAEIQGDNIKNLKGKIDFKVGRKFIVFQFAPFYKQEK
jgi:hypothetical protein